MRGMVYVNISPGHTVSIFWFSHTHLSYIYETRRGIAVFASNSVRTRFQTKSSHQSPRRGALFSLHQKTKLALIETENQYCPLSVLCHEKYIFRGVNNWTMLLSLSKILCQIEDLIDRVPCSSPSYDAFYDELAYCVAIGAINTSEARFDAFWVGGTSLQNSNKENEHQRTDKFYFCLFHKTRLSICIFCHNI